MIEFGEEYKLLQTVNEKNLEKEVFMLKSEISKLRDKAKTTTFYGSWTKYQDGDEASEALIKELKAAVADPNVSNETRAMNSYHKKWEEQGLRAANAEQDRDKLQARVAELEAEVERLEKDLEESIKTNFTLPCDGRCTECANQHRCYLEDTHRKIKTENAALQARADAAEAVEEEFKNAMLWIEAECDDVISEGADAKSLMYPFRDKIRALLDGEGE